MKVSLDLGAMSPRAFEDLVGRCGNKELKILLVRETGKGRKQDESVVANLYKELKKRGC